MSETRHRPVQRSAAGAISRADALRAYLALDPDTIAGPAEVLGFRWIPPRDEPVGGEDEPATKEEATRESAASPPDLPLAAPVADIPMWRCTEADAGPAIRGESAELATESRSAAVSEDELAALAYVTPPRPPIVAEARLRRRLDAELRTPWPSRAIDVGRLVDRLARGETISDLPRRIGLTQARLVLVLDASTRLTPLKTDLLLLAVALLRRLGRSRVRFGAAPGQDGKAFGCGEIAVDEIVLALTDLGMYGRERDRQPWVRLGRRLRADGAEIRALVPCPAWRWRGPGPQIWNAIDWSSPEGSGRRLPPRPVRGAPVDRPAEALLRLLSPALRVEPGLLRAARQRLGESADLATEVDVWRHSDADGTSVRGLEIDPLRRREAMRDGLEQGWNADLVADVARLIVAWHGERAPLVWATEVAHLLASGVAAAALGRARVEAAARIFEKAAAIAASTTPGGDVSIEAHRAFWRRESQRAPASLPDLPRFGAAWVRAVRAYHHSDPGAPLPAGMVPKMLEDDGADLPVRRYAILQNATGLRLAGAQELTEGTQVGSWLGSIGARKPEVFAGHGLEAPARLALASGGAEVRAPPIDTTLDLVTDLESVRLEAWKQPAWASGAGRDGYGLWVSFSVRGVEQRMRWIPPGRFRMGSAESEEGHSADEGPVHEVVLTEGYWLAETPCTQALWQAVMGDNSSHFRSPNRPVEQVTWEACQRFIDRLSFEVRDLELQLPTEAEWEYACRAGTQTATWRGDLEILGANNIPVLDNIAWYSGNSGVDYDLEDGVDSSEWPEKQHEHSKAGSRDVGQKPANPWGLYDMLGNVWEWCWGRKGAYRDAGEVDPEDPPDGVRQALRGGSWNSYAHFVRAACRRGDRHGERSDDLGFRLARGPRRARSRRAWAWVERLGWAADGGVDGYGRWAAIEVGGVRHRLRWIYPGRFLMGSPETEAGRWDDEGPRHEVMLTKGFWLGETPCTQDLWQAVMGSNPSRFQTPDRPVEQVSWEDCHDFYERLSTQVEGFRGRLPTEAQWEYACRAGTESATWLGDLEILGERNAPLLDGIAWYGGNSGAGFELDNGYDSSDWDHKQYDHTRTGTRRVADKLPNPWGLYDMLGNVWEWCSDRWDLESGYSGEPRVDPEGTDGSLRVFRGGSWFAHAQDVRAAVRLGRGPGSRGADLGFRLSRGPNEDERAEPEAEAGTRSGGSQARDEPSGRPRTRRGRPGKAKA